jgi:hypothetical protein
MKGAALPRLSTALQAVLLSLRSLRPQRGDRLTLLILTEVRMIACQSSFFPPETHKHRQGGSQEAS